MRPEQLEERANGIVWLARNAIDHGLSNFTVGTLASEASPGGIFRPIYSDTKYVHSPVRYEKENTH